MAGITIFEEYERHFNDLWPKLIPQDEKFAKHCLEVNKSIDDLPDDDPYIKKYFNSGLTY
ncbi:hypothetical protein [Limosilactobacillus antri]|uniref:hypothetical protein n=1 Tax=Limosilactobacillus antri TaxID=227943 RepID=UPI001F56EBF6|nr:hypothetical protein [Limosilactobacillus antri]